MNRRSDGEVLLRETYGSTSMKRHYVKPPDQSKVVVVNYKDRSHIIDWLLRIFLPQGYPDSVSQDYLSYQVWDTAQAFCSTISGILATQEVLRGVGVGDKDATPLAATITWIFKDGCGHLGRILFAYTHGTYLDAYSKKWRLYADILNNAAMCIEIALPLFKVYTAFALCISTVMKSIVGVAGGATRVAMTQHHAITGNMADVSAKDSAQETAVNLIASLTALFILTTIGNSLTIFMLMIILHVICNYFAVRAVCLKTLNEPRFLLVMENYLKENSINSPPYINEIEPIVFYQSGPSNLDLQLCGFKIKMGQSLKNLYESDMEASYLREVNNIYEKRKYILLPVVKTRCIYVLLKNNSDVDDVLCSYYHAVVLAVFTCAINKVPLFIFKEQKQPYSQIYEHIQNGTWSRNEANVPGCQLAYVPSYELMKYLDQIVSKEWPVLRNGLSELGWDLSKHLLVVDEWRVSNIE